MLAASLASVPSLAKCIMYSSRYGDPIVLRSWTSEDCCLSGNTPYPLFIVSSLLWA